MSSKRYICISVLLLLWLQLHAFMSNDSCHQAFEVYCGTVLIADWSSATSDITSGTCTYNSSRRGIWYKIVGTGDLIKASLCNYNTDISVFEGSCDSLICISGVIEHYNYKCGNRSSEVSFLSEIGKYYFLYCTTLNPHLGSRLEITCLTPADNNECQNAMEIDISYYYNFSHLYASSSILGGCPYNYGYNADLWYVIEGLDEYLLFIENCDYCNIPFNIYKGPCQELECVDFISLSAGPAFYGEIGEKYYVQILGARSEYFSFGLEVVEFPQNDSCNNALFYELGDTSNFSTEFATTDNTECHNSINGGVWYKFAGNDSVITFDISASFNYLSTTIFENDCDSFQCTERTELSRGIQTTFLSKRDSQYYMLITGGNGSGHFFSESSAEIINNRPDDGLTLICGDSLLGSFDGATSDYNLNLRYYPSVWYEIVGTDQFYSFSGGYLTPYYRPNFQVFSKYDNEYSSLYGDGYPRQYYLEQDSTYFLNVFDDTRDSFWLQVNCSPVVINDICTDAITIDLRDTLEAFTTYSFVNTDEQCGYYSTNRDDVWYHFVGDGTLKDVTFPSAAHRLAIFSGSCGNLACYQSSFNRPHWTQPTVKRIYFARDTNYYFKFFNRNSSYVSASFMLYTDNLEIADNDICTTATEISCGTTIIDSLDFAANNELNCDGSQTYYGGVWYTLEGADKYYYIEQLNPRYPPHIDVPMQLYKGSCNGLICHTDSLVNYLGRNVFWGVAGQSYYLMINSPSSQGPYELMIGCEDPVENNQIENATPIVCGATYKGYSFFADYTELETCNNSTQQTDIWFSITGNDEFLYIPDYRTGQFYVEGAYTYEGESLTCVSRIYEDRIYLDMGLQYYIRFFRSSNRSTVYDFDISFECHPKVENDDCFSAILMNCGDQVIIDRTHATDDNYEEPCGGTVPGDRAIWFKLIGDNNWKNYSIKDSLGNDQPFQIWSYEGSCENLTCLRSDRIFFAESGKDYFMSITRGYLGATEVTLTCHGTATNDECTDAITISCGESIVGDLSYAYPCDLQDPCTSGVYEESVWYKVIGTGGLVNLSFPNAINNRGAHVDIYRFDCCQPDQVVTTYGNSYRSLYFQSRLEEEYLISVSARVHRQVGEFLLSVECGNDFMINTCEEALTLVDGEGIEMNALQGINFVHNNATHFNEPLSWLKFNGSGGKDTLTITSENTNSLHAILYVDFNGDCALSEDLYYSMESLYDSPDSIVRVISTTQDLRYAVAIRERHWYQDTVETIYAILKQDELQAEGCSIGFPIVVDGYGRLKGQGLIQLNGHQGQLYISVEDPSHRNTFSINSDEVINLKFGGDGQKVLEYLSSECRGHLIFDFKRGSCFDSSRCLNPILYLDENGWAHVTPEMVYPFSTEGCKTLHLSLDKTEFSCADIGPNLVTLSVDEGCFTYECISEVTIVDNEPPQVYCHDIVLELDKNGEARLTTLDIDNGSSDPCSIVELSISQENFTCADIGINSVTLSAKDPFGNLSSCVALVAVQDIGVGDFKIVGPRNVCPNTVDIPFSITTHANVTSYLWDYSGAETTINDNGQANVALDFGRNAMSGNLKVMVEATCGTTQLPIEHDIALKSQEFCSLSSCLTEKLNISEQTIGILDSLDVFIANKEIMSNIRLRGDRVFIFRAGENIELNPGFEISGGVTLFAEIKKCLSISN